MKLSGLSSEISLAQLRNTSLHPAFHLVVLKGAQAGKLNKIFCEIRVLRNRMEELNTSMQQKKE